MEAELVRELPEGDEWQYEPKWDGFRGLLENASGELRLWSRNARPLLRYFPELAPLGELLPPRSCLDGEIVIVRDGVLDFDAMQTRLHPAESRVRKLSAEIPATFVAFDVLVWDGVEHWQAALASRRSKLEELARGFVLSPCTGDRGEALEWLDCVRVDRSRRGDRQAARRAVPRGRAHRGREGEAGEDGRLRRRRTALERAMASGGSRRSCSASGTTTATSTTSAPPRSPPRGTTRSRPSCCRCSQDAPERRFSEPNRWGGGELEEAPVRPEVVVEVRYDKVQGRRFRHGTKLLRLRPDKDPAQCTWRELRPPAEPGASVARLLER